MLTAVYMFFSKPILSLFGGTVNEETHAFAKEYFFYITLGIPFYMFGQAMNPVMRSDGSPKFAMAATVSGAIAAVFFIWRTYREFSETDEYIPHQLSN